jgi:hypothetical protein
METTFLRFEPERLRQAAGTDAFEKCSARLQDRERLRGVLRLDPRGEQELEHRLPDTLDARRVDIYMAVEIGGEHKPDAHVFGGHGGAMRRQAQRAIPGGIVRQG